MYYIGFILYDFLEDSSAQNEKKKITEFLDELYKKKFFFHCHCQDTVMTMDSLDTRYFSTEVWGIFFG